MKSSRCRTAFVAGKKVGKAVARNRAKRLLRAHLLEELPDIVSGEYIFVAKAPIVATPYAQRRKAFRNALKKAGLLRVGSDRGM